MITETKGNLLEADVEALVNTVNCVGIMGKGIALQFKKAFPENFKDYEKACEKGQVLLGKMFLVNLNRLQNPRYIINFPTKKHWHADSRLKDIATGLEDLVRVIKELKIHSVAIPPLGCGHGGLEWNEVRHLIEKFLSQLVDVQVMLYPPIGAPKPEQIINRTIKPAMTEGRAAIIGLMGRYVELGYRLTLLEIHKLAYFLQLAGQNLRLNFAENVYGPYADNLRHVLNHLDGHFIQGYGDGNNKPSTVIVLLPGAAEEANKFLDNNPETRERFQKVAELVEGFETPYGMELLATVHWVACRDPHADAETVVKEVHNWNDRKQQIMKPEHIRIALQHLKKQGWV
jgi:O-acetyl-ADP-ribose deacetylase (regulator of RNase III)